MSDNKTPDRSIVPFVAIIDTDEDDLVRTAKMLSQSDKLHLVGVARKLEDLPLVMTSDPDIALLDVGADSSHLRETLRQILNLAPRCQVILTAPASANLDIRKAAQLGARGLLPKPLTPGDVMEAIHDVFFVEQSRLRRIEEQATIRVTQGRAGEVITVFSPKGGVGCTVIASHLAIALAGIEKSRVALVDFDLQFGDIAVHLNLNSTHGIHELMRSVDDLDGSILNDVMVQHTPSGVKVLLPPPIFEQVEDITTEGLLAVTKALRKFYDYVVVDTWHSVEEATLGLVDLSDALIVVTTPEVPALRSTRRFLDFLRERPDRRQKVQIVLNRYPSKGAVQLSDIERSLGAKPTTTIPSDGRLVVTSINEGIPFLNKQVPATASIKQLANTLVQPRLNRMRRSEQGQQSNVAVRAGS